MKNRLKALRNSVGLSQTTLAEKVGVSQPHYHRWEAGDASIPEAQLNKLAKLLKTTPKEIIGATLRVIEPPTLGDEEDDRERYMESYGEVIFHFVGGGRPLMLSILGEEWSQLFRRTQEDDEFIAVTDYTNQTVILRRQAIAETWFSDDAADDYGPEDDIRKGGHYVNQINIDGEGDWMILQNLAHQCYDFDEKKPDHERVLGEFMNAEGADTPRKRSALWKQLTAGKCESLLLKATTNVTYQLSNGQRRSIHGPYDEKDIYWFASPLVDFPKLDPDRELLLLKLPDAAQSAFIDPRALDYVIVPTHMYEKGQAASTDETEED